MAAERQTAPDLAGIKPNHVARYRFAARLAGVVGSDVLDAGCGCGYGSALLADAGCRVRGVDKSAVAIEYATVHWGRPRVIYSETDARHAPGSYDWVVCLEMLEHVEDDGGLLRRFAQLAPRLLVSVPKEGVVPHHVAKNPFHVRHYTLRELEALLRGAGWAPEHAWAQTTRDEFAAYPFCEQGATLLVEARRA